MPKMQPDVFSSPVIKRYNGGKPVLLKEDIPYPADLVFNAGVAKIGGKYVMDKMLSRGHNAPRSR